MWNFLKFGLLALSLFGSAQMVLADEPEEGKMKGMFDGKFKCSDGYDPDTDPSLHPPGQDPRTREIVNAQYQAEHEKKVSAGESSVKTESGSKTDDAEKTEKTVSPEKKEESEKKDKDKDKEKDKEKKDDKKDDKKEERQEEKKEEKSKAISGNLDVNKASSPINRALFAIQSKHYQESADLLNGILKTNAKDAQAHYLLAVSYVGLRRYGDATEQYNLVLKSAADPKLLNMAKSGLQRISGSSLTP